MKQGKNFPLLPSSRAATIRDRMGFPRQGQAFQILPFRLCGRLAHVGTQQHVNSMTLSPVMLTSCEARLRVQARRGPRDKLGGGHTMNREQCLRGGVYYKTLPCREDLGTHGEARVGLRLHGEDNDTPAQMIPP